MSEVPLNRNRKGSLLFIWQMARDPYSLWHAALKLLLNATRTESTRPESGRESPDQSLLRKHAPPTGCVTVHFCARDRARAASSAAPFCLCAPPVPHCFSILPICGTVAFFCFPQKDPLSRENPCHEKSEKEYHGVERPFSRTLVLSTLARKILIQELKPF